MVVVCAMVDGRGSESSDRFLIVSGLANSRSDGSQKVVMGLQVSV